ncbi:hypothetical protein QYE76_067011 [Lolium multiflorum]|uniref:Transposase (putative) gypsy type domain-containing protein n=1 Tax=Lolium multiflorum TaxID=4521 RepID=A0AAD8SBL3_LOLMU|nr:hypothetical protein QYE76_067011 [Lolium multiflorum]
MAPRSKQCKNRAPGTEELVEKVKISGWERSKLSAQDHKLLKKMGLLKKEAMKMPRDESSPHPPISFRVTFVDFLTRGLAVPVHKFLRGMLFIYGIQLHQLTPNCLLHISIFITLCECLLGIHSHWGLWKRIFYLRRNNSKNVIYNVGGVCIFVRPKIGYFDVKFADSVQGWPRNWLYIKDESSDAQEYSLAPFNVVEDIQRRKSWAGEATAEEKPLQARKRPLWMYSSAEDADWISDDLSVKDLEKLVRRFTSLSKNHEVPSSFPVEPFSGIHALTENHRSLSSLPPLPEGGEVDERTIVADDSQELRVPLIETRSQIILTLLTLFLLLLPLLQTSARGRETMTKIPVHPNSPNPPPKNLLPKIRRSSTLTLRLAPLAHALHRAEERADDLEAKVKASETAHKKAEKDAAAVEDLRQRLQAAEDALSDKEAKQVEHENEISTLLETQS